MKFKYIVGCVGPHSDFDDDDEVDLARVRGHKTKALAEKDLNQLINGGTNMAVVLLKVEKRGHGKLSPVKKK